MTFTVLESGEYEPKEFRLTGSWMSYSAPFLEKGSYAHYFKSGDLKLTNFIYKKIPLSQISRCL